MKKIFKIFVFILVSLISTQIAHADWEANLKNNFDIVDTFDNLQDWYPSRKNNGNNYGYTYTPKKLNDATNSMWSFYSSWGKVEENIPGPWISDFGEGTKITGKSAVIDIDNKKGPSRFGTYFGNGSSSSGYSDIYVFYRSKYPQNEWPTTKDAASIGSYVEGDPWAYWASWKSNTMNMGCTSVDANTGCSGAENYSDYHIVPHIKTSGGKLLYRIEATGYADYPDIRTAWTSSTYEIPRATWIGTEFHYGNFVDENGLLKTKVDVWLYDADGSMHKILDNKIFDYTNLTHPSTDKWNFFFIGGNNSGYFWGPTMESAYFIDDFIIDDQQIGTKYFNLLNGNVDNVAPASPSNLNIQ